MHSKYYSDGTFKKVYYFFIFPNPIFISNISLKKTKTSCADLILVIEKLKCFLSYTNQEISLCVVVKKAFLINQHLILR